MKDEVDLKLKIKIHIPDSLAAKEMRKVRATIWGGVVSCNIGTFYI
jgi:hypothetical protein